MSAEAPGGAAAPAPGAASPLVGTVLAGRYRILAKLGEGAMGAVYLGEHLRIGRRDAIKVLRESLEGDAEALARFNRGTRNVSLVQHPNVCTVYDFGDTDDGRSYLAMEYVPGETLQDLLRREGSLPPARAQGIFAQVAGALQAAHDAGIVHRDLKPGNVMVSPGRGGADAVKVVDFDIAKGSSDGEPGDVTRLGFVIGTPEYMSPEQLLGMALDGRSDVYSLGIMFFRMLAGALPFRAADTQELMVQRLTGAPLRLDEVLPGLAVPPALQAALDRALQRRAEDRFGTAAAFADAVAAALAPSAGQGPPVAPPVAPPHGADAPPTRGGVPLTVLTASGPPPPSAPPRSWRPARGRLLGAVLAAVLAGAAVWGASRGMGPPRGGESTPSQDPGTGGQTAEPAPADPPQGSLIVPADSLRRAREDSARMAGPGTAGQVAAGSGPGTSRTPADPSPAGHTAPPRTGSTAARPAGAGPSPGERVASGPDDRGETEKDRRPPPRPPENGDELTAENAPARVAELLDRMAATSAPSPGALRNIRAAAARIYRLEGTTAVVRSQAAQVAADAASQLGDPGGCVEWAERSLQARPTNGARLLRDQCQGVQP